jgi:hypothetical protein
MTATPPDEPIVTDEVDDTEEIEDAAEVEEEGTYLFHDVVLDFVPYEELPYAMLLDKAELGDEAAEAELNRRAEEQVEKDIQAIVEKNRAKARIQGEKQ